MASSSIQLLVVLSIQTIICYGKFPLSTPQSIPRSLFFFYSLQSDKKEKKRIRKIVKK